MHIRDREFDPFAFRINDNALPEMCIRDRIKPVFGFQLLAYLLVAVHIVPVRNGLAVVVYAVEHDMHMRCV